MKKIINIVYVVLLTVALFISGLNFSSLTVSADTEENWPIGPDVAAWSAILIEASTGSILYSKNIDEQMYPASITKILTALIALENSSLDDEIVFSSEAINSLDLGAANIGIKEGESLSMEDALYALLLHSANEVANGIAEHVSGSVDEFSEVMNQRALEAGAVNSNFENPSGLFDEDHYTTCFDMAMITRECIKNSSFLKIDSATSYTITDKNLGASPIEFSNRNQMLLPGSIYYYPGIIGGKTGYLDKAGRTLISVVRRDNMTLIAVVMKTSTEEQFTDAIKLMDYGFNNFSLLNIAENETHFSINGTGFLASANSILDKGISSNVTINTSDYIVLPNNVSFIDVDAALTINDDESSNDLATIDYTYLGNSVGSTTLLKASEKTYSETSPYINQQEDNEPLGLDWQIRINIWVVSSVALLVIVFLIIKKNFNVSRLIKPRHKRKFSSKKKNKLHF